jgi:hypothetical protein
MNQDSVVRNQDSDIGRQECARGLLTPDPVA